MSDFSIKADGLYYKEEFVSEFWPEVKTVQFLTTSTERSGKKRYSVCVHLTDGRTLTSHSFSSIRSIPYFETWQECKDALLTAKQKRLLYSYLQEQTASLPQENIRLLQKLGLYDCGLLFGKNQMILTDKQKPVNFITSPDLPDFPYMEVEKEDMTAYAIRLLALKPGVTDILFSISLLSVLKPLFVRIGYPLNFFVSIYGQPGSMKSLLAELFFVQVQGQMVNFMNSSKKDIELALKIFEGHTVVIDDYHPTSNTNDKQKLASRMDMIARSCNDKDQALAVITGEFLDGSFSVQDRMIQVFLDTPIENLSEFNSLQQKSYMLSYLLYEFAKNIYSEQTAVVSFIKKWFEESSYPTHKQSVPSYRIERNIQFLGLSLELFQQYFLEDMISAKNLDTTWISSINTLKARQIIQMDRLRLLDGDPDWLELLYEMLQMDFWTRLDDFPKKISGKDIYLIQKDDYIYIPSPILKKALLKFAGKKIKHDSLINALIAENLLKQDQSPTHMIKRDGYYYYAINHWRLKLYYFQLNGN